MSIIEVVGDICKRVGVSIGEEVNYQFADTTYVNTILSAMSRSDKTVRLKFPLIVLLTPFMETRDDPNVSTSARISLTIAVRTMSGYDNETRLQKSFIEQLRPIYDSFIREFRNHESIDVQYNGVIPHNYRERFDLGSRGAMDSSGKKLTDLIDAIEIENLEIKLKNKQCYGKRL